MLEEVPVHCTRGAPRTPVHARLTTHQRNLSLDFRNNVLGGAVRAATSGHHRNRSLDSALLLQRIPEDISSVTPTSPDAPPATPLAGSDDSGILCKIETLSVQNVPIDIKETTNIKAAAARSRESLDSGNPDDDILGGDADALNDDIVDGSDAKSDDAGVHEDEACCTPPDPPPEPPTKDMETARNKDFLLRLFESKLFDMSMAISYLFNSKEPGVQSYLANKLFSFPCADVDFYLPQLATMYADMGDVAEVLRPYLTHRCRQNADFSLRLAWLLAAFGGDAGGGRRKSRATRFREAILADEMRPPPVRRTHQRTQSDASALRDSGTSPATASARYLGDLTSGRAFDNGCGCSAECHCAAPRLTPQLQFVGALVAIGKRLAAVADKEQRNARLRAELATLDLNLPARVWLPLHSRSHCVLRIPPQAAAVLNSKDKAPYIMYVEVLEMTDGPTPLPARLLPPAPPLPHSPPIRHTKSEENLVPEWPSFSIYSPMEDPDMEGCWSQEDDDLTAQYLGIHGRRMAADTLSQLSGDSCSSRESVLLAAGDVRRRLADATAPPPANTFRHDPSDPSAQALKESWASKEARVRSASPYGHLASWKLLGCIVKCGDDLRQELLASQLLRQLQVIWDRERVPLKLHPYTIVCLDNDSGLIEPVLNTVSLHQIKRHSGRTLRAWMELEHGPSNSEGFLRAQTNFVESAAAYAVTSYLLQLKDRHNGNILLDSSGHLIHIDFGFIMSISPKNLGFETSPFKLTGEFVEVMDGETSDMFQYFKILMLQGLVAARKHMDQILHIVEIMRTGGQLACLRSSAATAGLRARFHLGRTEAQLSALVDRLVSDALHSLSTRLYDGYQYYTNGAGVGDQHGRQ